MATFTSKDKEIVAAAERLLRDKTNILGADGYIISEPYGRNRHEFLSRIMRNSPARVYTSGDGYALTTPDFDDYPIEGQVGVRRENVRLHSYLPSGKTGPESVQSFIIVYSPPISNSVADIEDVRLNPIINPEFSVGRATAAEANAYVRGFELALYPAKSSAGVGTPLVADTDNGPISAFADPSAGLPQQFEAGAGDEGFWTVDYDAGIVRFSKPPLNGSNGVMNPNNVFGDINGNEVASNGAITMFATFYAYSGTFGFPDNMSFVTVGDDINSFGVFSGNNHNTVQAAIDSLPSVGGTVFIKEGDYTFTDAVTLPDNVAIIGLNAVRIKRPDNAPAFIIEDGYCSIENLEIYTTATTATRAAIELRSTTANQIIREVELKGNTIYAAPSSPAIYFAPSTTCTYRVMRINDNAFRALTSSTTYIGGLDLGGSATIQNSEINNNDFGPTNDGTPAITINTTAITGVSETHIVGNRMENSTINITVSGVIAALVVDHNYCWDNITISCGSTLGSLSFNNNHANDVTIESTGSNISDIAIVGNSVADLLINFVGTSTFINVCDNIVQGILQFTGNDNILRQINITGNIANSSMDFFHVSQFQWFNISTNNVASTTMQNTVGASTTMDDGVISDNIWATSGDALSINANKTTANTLDGITIAGNSTDGTIRINNAGTANSTGVLLSSTIADNWALNIDINGAVQSSNITGNTLTGNLTMGDVTFTTGNGASVISNNSVDTGITINSLTNSVVTGNTVDSNLTISSSISDTIISNNVIELALSLGAGMTSSIIADNKIFSILTLREVFASTIVGNDVDNGISITSIGGGTLITNSIISNNSFFSTMTISNTSGGTTMQETTINGNNITGAVTIGTAATDTLVMDRSTFQGNMLSGNLSCGHSDNANANLYINSSIADNVSQDAYGTFLGRFVNSNITNNVFNEIATGELNESVFESNILLSVDVLSQSVIGYIGDDGSLTNSIFNNNIFNHDLFIAGPIANSTINNNHFVDLVVINATFNDSILSTNNFSSTLDIVGTAQRSAISGNTLTGAFTTAVLTDCIIANNAIQAAVVTSDLTDVVFAGNRIDSTTSLGDVIDGTIVDNSMDGQFDMLVVSASTVADNKVTGSMNYTGNCTNSAITGNRISSSMTFSTSVTSVNISNNNLGGALTVATATTNAIISGNYIQNSGTGALTTGTPTDSVIANNVLEGGIDCSGGVTSQTVIAHNSLSGSTNGDLQCDELNNSMIIGNYIASDLLLTPGGNFSTLDSSVVSDNFIDANCEIDITDNTADLFFESIFSNNVIDSTTTWGGSIASGDSDRVLASSIVTGNMFGGTFTCGGASVPTTDVLYEDSVFSNNYIDSTATLRGTANNTEFVGNRINGSLTSDALRLSGTFTGGFINLVPRTSGDPGLAYAGDAYVDATSGRWSLYDGTQWSSIITKAYVVGGGETLSPGAGSFTPFNSYSIPRSSLVVGSLIEIHAAINMDNGVGGGNFDADIDVDGSTAINGPTVSVATNKTYYLMGFGTVTSPTDIAWGGFGLADSTSGTSGITSTSGDPLLLTIQIHPDTGGNTFRLRSCVIKVSG